MKKASLTIFGQELRSASRKRCWKPISSTDVQNGLSGGGKAEATEASGPVNVDQQTSRADEMEGVDLFLGAMVIPRHCLRLAQDGQNVAGSF